MMVHTIWSESHRPLMAKFRESLFRVEPSADLVEVMIPQHGSGRYDEEGFKEAMREKLRHLQRVCRETKVPFLYADCDVIWLRPFLADLGRLMAKSSTGLLCQQHGAWGTYWPCAGMMAMRPGLDRFLLWTKVEKMLPRYHDDEEALRDLSGPGRRVGWDPLPERYWTQGMLGHQWEPGQPLDLPVDAVCLHASWTVGVANKLAMFDEAERLMAQ